MNANKNDQINIEQSEIKELLKKELSHGTDGRVIKYDNKLLLKLYHHKLKLFTSKEKENETLKNVCDITNIKQNNFNSMFNYYQKVNDEIVRLDDEAAMSEVKNKQFLIKKTRLPSGAVYIDGKFVGCILIAQRGIQIHKLTMLPMKFKIKIMHSVLENVKELLDNFVYHVDLANSPYTKNNFFENDAGIIENVGHSHVIVNPITLKPVIIDLDGKSTIYTNYKDEIYESRTISCLNTLMLEFLLGINLDEYDNDEDLAYLLSEIGVKMEYIDSLSTLSLPIEESFDFIESLKGRKGL